MPIEWYAAMRRAQRLKRLFGIDIENCAGCGGTMRIIARIKDSAVIKAILAHLAGAFFSGNWIAERMRIPLIPLHSKHLSKRILA